MITDSQQTDYQQTVGSRRDLHWTDRLWLATMSIANGVPFAIIFLLAVMFKRFGLNNSTVAFNISFACLPWVIIRPACHLLLRRVGWSKDVWLLATELVIALSLLLMSESVASDLWFQQSMIMLIVITTSATIHNLSTESLYKEITCNPYPTVLRPLFVAFHSVSLLFCVGFLTMFAGNIEVVTRNPQSAWATTLRVAALFYGLLWVFHLLKVWKRNSPSSSDVDINNLANRHELLRAVRLFFGKRSVSIGAMFFMLFMLPQGLTWVVSSLFIIDSTHRGGLGLSPQEYGLTVGTVGTIGLTIGALLCLRLLKRYPFHRLLLPFSAASLLPAIAGMVLSHIATSSLAFVNVWVFLSHAAIGVVVTTFMSFLAYYSCGKFRPTFYSIGIALLFLSLFLTGLYSGSLQRYYGYRVYFAFALAASVLSPVAATILKLFCFRKNTK